MWAALNGDQRNAATVALIFCGLAVWGFSAGNAPLPKADLNGSLIFPFVISLSTSIPPLMIAAAIATRRDKEAYLLSALDHLKRQNERTNVALGSAKRHFQILIEGIVDYAIFLVDTAGRVASWNSAAQKIIGYSPEEIIGKHFGIIYRPDERREGKPKPTLE